MSEAGSADTSPMLVETADSFPRKGSMAASEKGKGRTNLLAVDASENAKCAFEWYMDNIHRPEDTVCLVHSPETPNLKTFSFKSGIAPPVDEWKKALDEMNSKCSKIEEDYCTTLAIKKIKYKMRQEVNNKPGESIVKIAEEEKADMICMGTRGIGLLKRTLLGSVSDYVVHNTRIPCIIIPKL